MRHRSKLWGCFVGKRGVQAFSDARSQGDAGPVLDTSSEWRYPPFTRLRSRTARGCRLGGRCGGLGDTPRRLARAAGISWARWRRPVAGRAQSFRDAGPSGAATSPTAPRKLGTAFRCPICKRAESVECRIDPRRRVAEASCCECEASYSAAADALTEPIDVYCEWIGVRRDYDGDVMMADA
uniref:Transcription elongation factor 1 homolog n=1 Tax=Setaria viridis TaxID=4556 RepID=A0A4U6V2L1_SETVI|nr:hypothetical protein SEVIR_4G278700v2 [Setaria viridis]